jgi:hypothetical protein
VREHFAQGSVRGEPGDWFSYRDGHRTSIQSVVERDDNPVESYYQGFGPLSYADPGQPKAVPLPELVCSSEMANFFKRKHSDPTRGIRRVSYEVFDRLGLAQGVVSERQRLLISVRGRWSESRTEENSTSGSTKGLMEWGTDGRKVWEPE